MIKSIDNKGITLVELIIAIAIATIVITSIAFFMSNSSKNYKKVNEEVSLQMEAQTILNQLNDLILEADNVKMKDNILFIYNESESNYFIKLDVSSGKMFLNKTTSKEASPHDDDWVLFGQDVSSFTVTDTGDDNTNKAIQITLHLNKDTMTYTMTNLVTIRNDIKPIPD